MSVYWQRLCEISIIVKHIVTSFYVIDVLMAGFRGMSRGLKIFFIFFDSNKLRMSRSAVSAADVTSEVFLGVEGEPFKFTQCTNQITIAEVSALTGKVEGVEQFIREHVKQ